MNNSIAWYQELVLALHKGKRAKAVARRLLRKMRHGCLCVGIGTELYAYEAVIYQRDGLGRYIR